MTTTALAPHVRNCRSCDAPIVWARTLGGRTMPVDAEPSPAGNIELNVRQGFVRAAVHTSQDLASLFDEANTPAVMHTSHFATCPDADEWRKQ